MSNTKGGPVQAQLTDNSRVEPGRPYIPGYGIPESVEGTLPWSHVEERLEKAANYWVGTVDKAGRPHVVPVWGVWVEGVLYFGGGPETRWSRNLAANPQVAVHLESGQDVVIIEGTVERITDPKHALVERIDDAYEAKYQMRHGIPLWVLRPRIAFAWSEFPHNATRWRFGTTKGNHERGPYRPGHGLATVKEEHGG